MRRRLFDVTNTTIAVILGLALFLMVNYLGFRHYQRWDLTKEKVYSLTEQSRNVLADLTDDVKIYVLFNPMSAVAENLEELLKRYQAASDRINIEHLDPEKNLVRVKELAEKYGITQDNVLVVTSGEKKKFVYEADMAELDYSGMQFGQQPKIKAFKGEEAITSAIMSVTEETQVVVGFVAGHGEKDPSDYDRGGISQWKSQLEKENYEVRTLTLLGKEKMDEDIDVLIIPGPRSTLTKAEVELLRTYLAGGGRLLLLADPVFPRTGSALVPLGVNPLLLEYGVKLMDDVVLDTGKMLPFTGPETIFVNSYGSHSVTDKLQNLPTIFPLARGVQTVTPSQNVTTTPLLSTSSQGWGEVNLAQLMKTGQVEKDENDHAGPVHIGVAVEAKDDESSAGEEGGENRQAPRIRMAVIGDADFISNAQIANQGNLNLALNLIHWLSERETLITIPSKKPEQAHIRLSKAQMRRIFLLVILLMPAVAVAMGIWVWRMRRK